MNEYPFSTLMSQSCQNKSGITDYDSTLRKILVSLIRNAFTNSDSMKQTVISPDPSSMTAVDDTLDFRVTGN